MGLTRSRGVTVVAGPPDPYGLIGMIQTIYCYYYTAYSTTWEPDAALYPFEDRPQDILATIRLLEPVFWGPVPLALRITFPDATFHALRLTLRHRRLPHDEGQVLALMGELSIPRSREVRLSTASGAIPVLTPAAPVHDAKRCRDCCLLLRMLM